MFTMHQMNKPSFWVLSWTLLDPGSMFLFFVFFPLLSGLGKWPMCSLLSLMNYSLSHPQYLLKCFHDCFHCFLKYLQIRFILETLWLDNWTTCNLVHYRKVFQPPGLACCTPCPLGSHWVHHWNQGKNQRERGLGKGVASFILLAASQTSCQRTFVSGWKNPSSS